MYQLFYYLLLFNIILNNPAIIITLYSYIFHITQNIVIFTLNTVSKGNLINEKRINLEEALHDISLHGCIQ